MEMIVWVDEKLKTWGEAKRRINGQQKQPKSLMGKIKDGWTIKSAKGALRPIPPEVMLKEALITARAIQLAKQDGEINDRHYDALYAIYVLRGPMEYKAAMVGVSERHIYRLRNTSHSRLECFILACEYDHDKAEQKQELEYGT